jgi:hypothetical protein
MFGDSLDAVCHFNLSDTETSGVGAGCRRRRHRAHHGAPNAQRGIQVVMAGT